jgi:hypothetical protein
MRNMPWSGVSEGETVELTDFAAIVMPANSRQILGILSILAVGAGEEFGFMETLVRFGRGFPGHSGHPFRLSL